MDRPTDSDRPVPLQPESQSIVRPIDLSLIPPEITQAIKDFFRSHTLNGHPIDVEGNNIRVVAQAITVQHVPTPPPTHVPINAVTAPRLVQLPPAGNQRRIQTQQQVAPRAPADAAIMRVRGREHNQRHLPQRGRNDADISIYGHFLLPVSFKRADGLKTITAYLDVPLSALGTPLDPDSYYTAGGGGSRFSFAMSDASDTEGAKVLILDGLVGTADDQDLPSGMGGDDYILTVSDGDAIWVGVTYDGDTQAITSRFIDSGGSPPDDSYGAFSVKIGDVAVDTSGTTPVVTPTNSHCGDIIFELVTGAVNGVPSVIPLASYGAWVEIPEE